MKLSELKSLSVVQSMQSLGTERVVPGFMVGQTYFYFKYHHENEIKILIISHTFGLILYIVIHFFINSLLTSQNYTTTIFDNKKIGNW